MKKETGGMAYPNKTVAGGWDGNRTIEFNHDGGLTVRDYFAAAAIQGILSNEQASPLGMDFDTSYAARHAYRIADKMLEARK